MLLELQSFWKEYNGSAHVDNVFRRIGVLFSRQNDSWIFIVMFESKPESPNHVLKFSCLQKSHDRESDVDGAVDTKTPTLLTVSALIQYLMECILRCDPNFLMTLVSDIVASLVAI